jgi:hypothetical protein
MASMPWRLSPEIRVMLSPKRGFAEAKESGGRWLYWRRPILLVLSMCTAISLLVTGRLSLHVVGSTSLYWSFLPLIEIAGIAVAERRWPKSAMVDRFFWGHGPWLMFVIALTAYASSESGRLPSQAMFRFWIGLAVAALVWSCWIDYRFFGSLRKLAVQRAVSWTLFAAITSGAWVSVELSARLGL